MQALSHRVQSSRYAQAVFEAILSSCYPRTGSGVDGSCVASFAGASLPRDKHRARSGWPWSQRVYLDAEVEAIRFSLLLTENPHSVLVSFTRRSSVEAHRYQLCSSCRCKMQDLRNFTDACSPLLLTVAADVSSLCIKLYAGQRMPLAPHHVASSHALVISHAWR